LFIVKFSQFIGICPLFSLTLLLITLTCCNDGGFETGFLGLRYDTDLEEYVVSSISKFTEWYPDGSAQEAW